MSLGGAYERILGILVAQDRPSKPWTSVQALGFWLAYVGYLVFAFWVTIVVMRRVIVAWPVVAASVVMMVGGFLANRWGEQD